MQFALTWLTFAYSITLYFNVIYVDCKEAIIQIKLYLMNWIVVFIFIRIFSCMLKLFNPSFDLMFKFWSRTFLQSQKWQQCTYVVLAVMIYPDAPTTFPLAQPQPRKHSKHSFFNFQPLYSTFVQVNVAIIKYSKTTLSWAWL